MTLSFHERLAASRPWLVRVALGASVLALVATSAPPRYNYTFKRDPEQRTRELTVDEPTVVYRVTMRANALGPDRVSTTMATAKLQGAITTTGLADGAPIPFVDVSIFEGETMTGGAPVSVLTGFGSSLPLHFQGDCRTFSPTAPCETTLTLTLSRSDAGAGGGIVIVNWSLALDAFADKSSAPSVGPIELPWTVTIEEL